MHLPRRVPWHSISELESVCAWIYTDERDLDTKALAINRLSAWRTITPLPHALDSTLSLLVVLQQDRYLTGSSSPYLPLRQSYAAATIRLVNGLVDPLQLGVYARSIASIAEQLDLPAWLVELRHAATHGDLPSLECLREAARQSMAWLLHNYFLPTINPGSVPQREPPPLRPIGPVLKQYKSLMKNITRDAYLRRQYNQEINTIMRDIERWISEATVATSIVAAGIVWDRGEDLLLGFREGPRDGSTNPRETWALEKFCDALLDKGGLVPLSKRKRMFPVDKFWPPDLSISLWAPLLQHIQVLHADFVYVLCTRILLLLLPPNAPRDMSADKTKNYHSFNACLVRWVMWLLDNWSSPELDYQGQLKKNVVSLLMRGLGHRMSDPSSNETTLAKTLLQTICSKNFTHAAVTNFLCNPPYQLPSTGWTDHDMIVMTDRLTHVLSYTTPRVKVNTTSLSTTVSLPGNSSDSAGGNAKYQLPDGWRRVEHGCWKQCPIGTFQGA